MNEFDHAGKLYPSRSQIEPFYSVGSAICDRRHYRFISLQERIRITMAKITFKQSDGFVGGGTRLELNLNSLPISMVRNITRLVEEAQFFDLPENLIRSFKPDESQYTITVDAGITNHTVHTNDSTMPRSLRLLVKELSLLSSTTQEVNTEGLR
jgi:hypothetical protein